MSRRIPIRRATGFAAVLIACFSEVAWTQAQAPGPQLSLQDAQAIALKNHPQVLAAQANFLRAGQIVTEARSAYYPSLNGNITGAQANVNSRLGAGVINDPRLFNHFGSGVSLSQLITDSGRTPNLVASERFRAQASQQEYQATRYDIILGVGQAYYEVLLSQELIKVAQQTVATRQTVVEQVTALTQNQLKSQVDLSFAQVNLSDAQLMLIRARDRLATAYANLGQALGTTQAAQYQLIAQPKPPAPPDNPDQLIAQAYQNRPELAGLRLQREAAQKFVYAERDLKRPTVNLLGVAGVLPYINPGNANPDIPEGYEAVAVNVQIPVFNGHLFTARRRAAEYELQAEDQRVRDLQDRIARDVRAAWEHMRTAFEAIAPSEQLLAQANMALNLSQGRYHLGLASIVELTQAQLGQTQAQVQNLSAQYDYAESYAALQYTLGLLH
ncbi:MAG TPA: TolC family protein [Bryobacteraceae bacterium]|jgi:outer membrane protein|nr:TolC family protein [Bryobacteraceae bacterium]